jgi:hypothetical protein
VFALGVSPRGGLAGFIERHLTLAPLSPLVGVSIVNLSVLKNDRARAPNKSFPHRSARSVGVSIAA